MQIIDGKALAESIIQKTAEKIKAKKLNLRLDAILVGENPASRLYVKKKQEACEKAGVKSVLHVLPEDSSQAVVAEKISELNENSEVTGILLQLPLPKHLGSAEEELIELIAPQKDIDGMTSASLGKLMFNSEGLVSCTPKGIMKLIESTGVDLEGKNAVIVNHSRVVGKPLGLLLLQKNATVEFCHEFTKNLSEHTSKADVLITAVGKSGLITAGHVKKGAVIIDAGISRLGEKTVGDVDFESVKEKASFITPVPGGVGPMTVACLVENTLIAGLGAD
ncbi:MAG: bifunctional 5,10-methylenetetrahydrofolate dehydrogenase/5,10-methenyltetrahydrofolate cyclohydrolase [Candidatus Diapherotrites archaeon]|nr:bifunctional 5,10-methylenetetrahydrofolate dehydrogenase/5,10-methenyltetrahydrofolate cyclohydrolase [Candidatus Diapherotrites archaeon]